MKALVKSVFACAFVLLGLRVQASVSPTADATTEAFIKAYRIEAPAKGDLKTGQWYHGLSRVRDYAEEKGIPLVAVYSGSACSYCETFEKSLQETVFANWLKTGKGQDYLFCFTWTKDSDGSESGAVRTWCKNGKKIAYPHVRLYWKPLASSGKQGVDQSVWGDDLDGSKVDGKAVAAEFEKAFAAYSPYAYGGARFVNGASASDRLEARSDTTFVDVPLMRPVEQAGKAASETLSVRFPGVAKSVEYPLAWEAGQGDQTVRVDLRPAGFVFEAGKSIVLTLSTKGETSPEVQIALVDEPANSPKNPLWIGTRTADKLKAGEWTMDLEKASERAQKRGKPLLALVGGSLWCPDCVKVDHYLIDTKKFKKWLQTNDVSCVALDVPNIASDKTTSLLTYDPYEVSERYRTATSPEQDAVQSGAGYLSRNMIEPKAAEEIASRNRRLITTSVTEGGLCRPENMDGENAETGPFKTGIPCLILMRPDGTVVGRIFQFNNVSPSDTSATDAYLSRMNELVGLMSEPAEEDNGDWRTTKEKICLDGGEVSATVSAVDLVDTYRLDPFAFTVKGTIEVKATTAKPGSSTSGASTMAKEDNVELSLLQVKEGVLKSTKLVKGNVYGGVKLTVTCSDVASDWFVRVRALGTVNAAESTPSKTFSLERKDLSTVGYALKTALKYETSTLTFESSSVTVQENKAGTFQVKVLRQDALTGSVGVRVELDKTATTALPGSYEIDGDSGFEKRQLNWADGKDAAQALSVRILNDAVYDGDRKIVLRLKGLSGDPLKPSAGTSKFTITVKEDDKAVVGKLAIVGTTPALASDMKAIVREKTDLGIVLERVNGASKPFGAKLTATAGQLSSNRVDWVNNDRQPLKNVVLSLPSLADAPKGGAITVTLKPDKGIEAVSGKKKLTVQLVSGDCPEFARSEVAFPGLLRYVSWSDSVEIRNWQGGTLSVTKLSGALPAGLSAKIDASGDVPRLVVSGVPTAAAADKAAVYQVFEKRNGVKCPGLTVKLTFVVTDVTKAAADGTAALNPAVAKSRTFAEQAVIDSVARRMTGLLVDVTLPPTGKASATYRCSSGKVALSAKSWKSCGQDGTLRVVLTTSADKNVKLTVWADPKGGVDYEMKLADGAVARGELAVSPWSKQKSASAFAGVYTVGCPLAAESADVPDVAPIGSAWMTFKMKGSAANTGTMTYAGSLPNGKTFSGSRVVLKREDEKTGNRTVVLPVLYRKDTDFFTAMAEIRSDAAAIDTSDAAHDHHAVWALEGVDPTWKHTEPKTEKACFDLRYDLQGAYYDSSESVKACAARSSVYGSAPVYFGADGVEWDSIPVTLAKASLKPDKAEADKVALKLTFSADTGKVNGTFKFVPEGASKAVKATYSGILLPGLGGCRICRPGEILMPLVVGSYWYKEDFAYGKKSSVTILRGGAVAIDELTLGEE